MTAQDGSQPLEFQELAPEAMIAQAERFYAQMQARRSVRDFSDRPVPMRVIDQAILAAGTAPSGANKQPWHFAVTTDPEVKLAIRIAAEQEEQAFYERRASQQWLDALAPLGTDANKPFLQTAPVLVGVFMEKTAVSAQGERSKNYYPMESVGIACGLLISALHLSGLVTLTHTPSPMAFLSSAFERPKNEKPYLLLVVGYPAEHCRLPDISRKPLADIYSRVGRSS